MFNKYSNKQIVCFQLEQNKYNNQVKITFLFNNNHYNKNKISHNNNL